VAISGERAEKTIELKEPLLHVLIDHPAYYGTQFCRQGEAIGILDTGATLVVLPMRMAQQLGLSRIGKRDVDTPSGRHRATIFEAVVTIPVLGVSYPVEVASIFDLTSADIEFQPRVLLGKSLLQHLHFCMLEPERRYTLSVPDSTML
jgi:predicted aspartyl protease